MNPRNWFRSYMASQTITRSLRGAPKRRPGFRPIVEVLEDRTVPTAVAAPSGLVSWWTANNTAADRIGTNNATLYGVHYATGMVGQAFSFDGQDDWAALGNPTSLAFTASMTIEGWIKVNGLPTNYNFGTIMFRGDDRGGLDPYQLVIPPNGNLEFGISSATGAAASVQAPIPMGQFVHVAATLDDSTGLMTLYENGAVVAQTTTTVRPFGALDPTQEPGVGIGNSNALDNYNVPFNGLIDELSVYNRALTPGEVFGIYKAGSSGKVISPITVDDPSLADGSGGATTPVTFTVTRTGSLSGSLTVNWTTADDSAIAGTDYVAASGTVTFADGQATQTVTVTTLDNNNVNPNLDFKLIATPAGGTSVMGLATIANDDVPAPSGLVSWWTANGTAADLVGNNNGTLNNGVTYATGEVGQAFSFNNTNYVSASTSALPTGNSDRTMEMWVNVTAFGSGEAFFAGYGAFGSLNETYQLGADSSHRLFFSQWGQAINGPALQAGQWYHIAVTNVGNSLTLYLNGLSVATGSFTIATPSNTQFYIGRIPGSLGDTRQLNGMVDEVTVYNRALASSEIQSIYQAGSAGKIPPPVVVNSPSVVDGSGGATTPVAFTIARTGSLSGSLTVNWTTADDTAIAGTDYAAASGTVTFADGQATQTVQVTTLDSNISKPNLDFKLIATPVGGTSVMGLATIVNDDAGISVNNVAVTEGSTAFGSLGALVDQAESGDLNGASGMAIGPDGNLYVSSVNTSEVLRYNATTGAYMGVFVSSGSGGLSTPPVDGLIFRPDGKLYVASRDTSTVLRYDATTGAFLDTFIPANSGGLLNPKGMVFGPDGDLYISSGSTNQILRYDGTTGAFLGVFVAAGSGGLSVPRGLTFGPDGNLYVSSSNTNSVLRFNGTTGAFLNAFIPAGSGDLSAPAEVLFDNGSVFVSSQSSNQVLRFDATTGAFIEVAAAANSDGLQNPFALLLDANNNLLVGSNSSILRYGPASQAAFTVSLSSAIGTQVSVNYSTADGTALAGRDYTATSGTLNFAPGETTKTILVPTLDDGIPDPTTAFTVNLSNPTGGVITTGQGIGTILDDTKFYVVDGGSSDKTYQYASSGAALGNNALGGGDTAPRGVASTAAGTTEWVVDANKNVYVYSTGGALLGSWSVGGLSSSAQITGITTNGTDVWLVDSYSAKVYKYTSAAGRLSGSQNAASSFSPVSGRKGNNTNPQDLVTDGTSIWVVDGSALKVFKYTLSGSSLGSWSIDPANRNPTGITINPANVSDIWIVDNGTDKVYQYIGAASRTSGSQNAGATFALTPGNTNPQGIADPPPAGMMVPQASIAIANPPSVLVRAEAGSFGYAARPMDNSLWGQVMSAMPTNGGLLPLPGSQGEWNTALNLDLARSGALDYADAGALIPTLAGRGRSAPSSSPDLLDTVILDQVFADMA